MGIIEERSFAGRSGLTGTGMNYLKTYNETIRENNITEIAFHFLLFSKIK